MSSKIDYRVTGDILSCRDAFICPMLLTLVETTVLIQYLLEVSLIDVNKLILLAHFIPTTGLGASAEESVSNPACRDPGHVVDEWAFPRARLRIRR